MTNFKRENNRTSRIVHKYKKIRENERSLKQRFTEFIKEKNTPFEYGSPYNYRFVPNLILSLEDFRDLLKHIEESKLKSCYDIPFIPKRIKKIEEKEFKTKVLYSVPIYPNITNIQEFKEFKKTVVHSYSVESNKDCLNIFINAFS